MKASIFIMPTSKHTGLRILTTSIKYAIQQKGFRVSSFHPIFDMDMAVADIESYILHGKIKDYVELILNKFYDTQKESDFVVISGLFRQGDYSHKLYHINGVVNELNIEIIKALSSKVIINSYHGNKTLTEINSEISYACEIIPAKNKIIGAVITKLNEPIDNDSQVRFTLSDEKDVQNTRAKISITDIKSLPVFSDGRVALLGAVEWENERTYPRVTDIQKLLDLNVITNTQPNSRVHKIMMCSRNIDNIVDDLTPNAMIITSSDRSDVLVTVCLAAKNGLKIAGIILTAGEYLNDSIKKMCLDTAEECGLAIFTTNSRSVNTILKISDIDFAGIPSDDLERINTVKNAIINSIDNDLLVREISQKYVDSQIMSPPAFRYHLLSMARKAKKRIVLPESYEPRTLQSVKNCHDQGIADCVLIGDVDKINKVAEQNGFKLPTSVEILQLDANKEHKYIEHLMMLRRHKGLSEAMAREMLKDPITLGTMMLELDEVDGLVSGAEHSTADILRPALQIVKTKPGISLVSSVFFMCMPDEVIVFADCAVNQDPTAEQLVDIALQSSESAKQFGIDPRVAMISYSTGSSGSGEQVEKVRKATQLIQERAPDLLVDGPLQYDAAMIKSVADKKAPNSPVAGKATVLIFPDLNTGNTAYKAVQRSANVLSIGPVLQGINKPVNDLSRGATIDDIIYTIAITAIQAQ